MFLNFRRNFFVVLTLILGFFILGSFNPVKAVPLLGDYLLKVDNEFDPTVWSN